MIEFVKRVLYEKRDEIVRITKFALVGFVNTFVFSSFFFILYHLAGLHYLVATTAAYALATVNSFLINRSWTFDSRSDSRRKFVKFALINVLSAGINSLMMFIFVDHIGLNVWLSQVMTIMVTMCVNYIGNRLWTFRDSRVEG